MVHSVAIGSADARMRSIDTFRSLLTVPFCLPEPGGFGVPGVNRLPTDWLAGSGSGVPPLSGATAGGTGTGVGPATISFMSRGLPLGRRRDRGIGPGEDRDLEPDRAVVVHRRLGEDD